VGRVLQAVLLAAVVVAVFVVILPRYTDLSKVWSAIRSMTGLEYGLLIVATGWNILTYWPVAMAALPGLSLGQAAVVTQSSTSVAMTVPGGGAIAVAVSYAMYRSWGFRRSQIALVTLVTGIWNTFIKLAIPVLALAILAASGDDSAWLVSSALVGVAILAAAVALLGFALWRGPVARALGDWLARVVTFVRGLWHRSPVEGWGDEAVRFRSQMIHLLRARWLVLSMATVVSHLSLYVVFVASLRFVGIPERQLSWEEIFAVWAFVRLATTAPIIPGNVGLAELGYIGGLVLLGGGRAEVVAGVLVYRFLTYYVQIPIGGLTYLVWLRRRRWRKGSALQQDAHADAHEVQAGAPGQADLRQPEDREDRRDEEPAVPSPN